VPHHAGRDLPGEAELHATLYAHEGGKLGRLQGCTGGIAPVGRARELQARLRNAVLADALEGPTLDLRLHASWTERQRELQRLALGEAPLHHHAVSPG